MIDNATWASLISRLLAGIPDKITSAHCRYEQLDALRVLAHRISAMSLESEFVRNHPAVEAFESTVYGATASKRIASYATSVSSCKAYGKTALITGKCWC